MSPDAKGGREEGELPPLVLDEDGEALLEMSGLRDRIEALERTMSATVGAGAAITLIFLVGATFMERSTTLLFLAALWSLFSLRLVVINGRSGKEKRVSESALESLEESRQASLLRPEASDGTSPSPTS